MPNRPGLEQGSDAWFLENISKMWPEPVVEATKEICRGYWLLNTDDPDRIAGIVYKASNTMYFAGKDHG